MPPKRRRRFQGLYYHSSPPKVLPMNGQASNHGRRRRDVDDFSIKLSTIRIWMHEKDIGKLTRILWAGQGSRLCQQASTNPRVKRFLSAVPYAMNSIKDVHQAVIDNNLETLQAKMEPPVPPALITCRDANGLNLMHKAAGLGHTKILEYLLSIWPDGVSETDITGKTPLHWAASHKNNMRCYTLLTQAGCDEEAMDYKMKTPTYYRHKPNEIERAFLVYVPEAPRVSPDVATDWEALSEEVGDGAKKIELKIPDTNGRTTDDSIENTSEVDLNDGISATEEEHPATPTVNGHDTVTQESANDDKGDNDEGKNIDVAGEIAEGTIEENGEAEANDTAEATMGNNVASEDADNEAEGEPKIEAIEKDVAAAEDQTNMKSLTETTTPNNGSDEQKEGIESDTLAAQEKSEDGEKESEISHAEEHETREKDKGEAVDINEKEGDVITKEKDEIESENEKRENERKEKDADKEEDDERKENITEENELDEMENARSTDSIEGDNIEDKEQEEENKVGEDDDAKEEKGIVEKLKESAQDLADSIKKAIGVEKEQLVDEKDNIVEEISDEVEKVKELDKSLKTEKENQEANNNEKEVQEEIEKQKKETEKEKEGEKVDTEDELNKETKDNKNENIKNEESLDNNKREDNNKITKEDEREEEKKKEKSENENENEKKKEKEKEDEKETKKETYIEIEIKKDAPNSQIEDMNKDKSTEEKTDSSKENTAVVNNEDMNNESAEHGRDTKIENKGSENSTTNDNNSNKNAQSPKTQDTVNVKEDMKETKKEATSANDKTEEDVSNEINEQLDKTIDSTVTKSETDSKTILENGKVETSNDFSEEVSAKPTSAGTANEQILASGEQKSEKIPRLTTAKVTRNKRNGSSKRNGSGKKNDGALVEGENEDDDDDDDDEDDEFFAKDHLEALQYSNEIIELPAYPCHSQNTEQLVHTVHESAMTVTDEQRMGHILSQLESRQKYSKLESRQNFMHNNGNSSDAETEGEYKADYESEPEVEVGDDVQIMAAPNTPENLDENHNEEKSVEADGSSPSSSLAIEGFVAGASEDNRVQSQSAAYVHQESYIKEAIDSGDMEQLAQIVLNGDGGKLVNLESNNPDIQAFLTNVPNYMSKIRRVHEAAREGSLLALQQALDRRKFAIAKDEVSPNGATPLHVAVLFGNSDIVRYLAARFPETTTITDNDGRTALHYAATINDNGHFYNILTQLGANSKALDKLGHTPEFYQNNEEAKDIINYKQILSNFGAEELADELLNDQGQVEKASSQMNPIFKTEQGKYLANNLADPLIKALTEIANKRPEDPVAFLANYLQTYMHERNPTEASNSGKTNSTAPISTSSAMLRRTDRLPQSSHNANVDEDHIDEDRITNFDEDEEETFANLDDRDEHGQSMLHFACARSHRRGALVQLIEESNLDITYRDELYRTARDVSLQANQPSNAKDIDRYVLSLAAIGDVKPFEVLSANGYDHIVDITDDNDMGIVDIAVERGHEELANFLQNLRTLEELREELHQMIRDGKIGRVKEIVGGPNGKWLLRGKNYYGRTALHIAVLKENEEIVEHFVSVYPEVLKIGDNLERTALHYAMGTNAIESLSRILIQKGAKRTTKDLKGRQPSYYFMNKADILRLQEEEEENR